MSARAQSSSSRIAIGLFLAIGLVVFGFPLYWMARGAIITQAEWNQLPIQWIPRAPTFDAFLRIFESFRMGRVLFNTFIVALLTMACNMLFDSLAGFALAKMRLPARDTIYVLLMATMMVPFEGLMVPLYLIVTRMGMANTLPGIVLPGAASAFSIIIMRQFFRSIPNELIEAARIDGAGWPRIFFSVAFPLATPALATVAIISFLAGWESFLWPLLITDPQSEFDVLQKVLAQATYSSVAGDQEVQWPWLMAAGVVATTPVLVLFLMFQRFFVAGLTSGSVKG